VLGEYLVCLLIQLFDFILEVVGVLDASVDVFVVVFDHVQTCVYLVDKVFGGHMCTSALLTHSGLLKVHVLGMIFVCCQERLLLISIH